MDQPHLIDGLDRITRGLGGVTQARRFDRMATVCHPDSGRVTASFAGVVRFPRLSQVRNRVWAKILISQWRGHRFSFDRHDRVRPVQSGIDQATRGDLQRLLSGLQRIAGMHGHHKLNGRFHHVHHYYHRAGWDAALYCGRPLVEHLSIDAVLT